MKGYVTHACSNQLENEFQFVFDCLVYNQEREMLFNYIINKEVGFLTWPRTFQLKFKNYWTGINLEWFWFL